MISRISPRQCLFAWLGPVADLQQKRLLRFWHLISDIPVTINYKPMQEPINKTADASAKENARTAPAQHDANVPADTNKQAADEAKEEIEAEVKESFKDENAPVEPAVGN